MREFNLWDLMRGLTNSTEKGLQSYKVGGIRGRTGGDR